MVRYFTIGDFMHFENFSFFDEIVYINELEEIYLRNCLMTKENEDFKIKTIQSVKIEP